MFQVNNIFILVLLIVLMGSIKLQTDIKKRQKKQMPRKGEMWLMLSRSAKCSVSLKFKVLGSHFPFPMSLYSQWNANTSKFLCFSIFSCVFCCVGKFNYSCQLTIHRIFSKRILYIWWATHTFLTLFPSLLLFYFFFRIWCCRQQHVAEKKELYDISAEAV